MPLRQPERDAKAGGSGSVPEPEASGSAPMDKFRTLARRLMAVSREDVANVETKRQQKARNPKE